MRTHLPATLSAVLVAGALAIGAQAPAAASCLFDERTLDDQIASADIVFVGTVSDLAHGNTTAQFEVEEVWVGDGLPELVTVVGGSGQDGAFTSVDRSYEPGERYLVFAIPDGARLNDNSCSPTRPWDEALAEFRPEDAEVRSAPGDANVVNVGDEKPADDGGFPVVPAVVAGLVVAGGATALAARRRAGHAEQL